ncbi:MAG: flagellar biosynthetic protein FliR [Sinimarinibacterium sp.]|jgi:flagellar biosynthetic protein FliR
MTFTEPQLLAWLQQYFWPFLRIGALMTIAPVIGQRIVSPRIRILLSLLLTVVIAPLLPEPAPLQAFAAEWFRVLAQQLLIGVVAGFVLVLVFEAVAMGAEMIAFGMGLSFAQLADPLRGVSAPVLGQVMTISATLLFLALGGHLVLIEMIVRSFTTLPVDGTGLGRDAIVALVHFSGIVFVGGLQLALPIVISLLAVNLAMGVISRSAPAMNLFAVGFPMTLIAGLVLLRAGLPAFNEGVEGLFNQAWELLGQLLKVG